MDGCKEIMDSVYFPMNVSEIIPALDKAYRQEGSMIYEIQQMEIVVPLFEGWQDTMIWSCLQNVMGHVYANSVETPASAMALLGDFCFLAGKPSEELALYHPEDCRQDFIIMVPGGEGWEETIRECYGEKARKVTRYAMKKEPGIFREEELREVVRKFQEENSPKENLQNYYRMKEIDKELFLCCREMEWCRDWVALYPDYETYQKYGLGIVIMKGEEIVAGASSYSGYHGGIEIEIDTKEGYRRQGLAYVCGAQLILECLDRGWYPSWDAQNQWSAALAEKLGYHLDCEYTAYEIWGCN